MEDWSYDKSIIIWNINDGSIKRKLTGHSNSVYLIAVLKNNDLAIS
jgi:WD40 repeat protein